MMSILTPIERVSGALTYLSAARQASIDEETFGVYMLALNGLEPDVIERACYALGAKQRKAFEPAMPTVGDIREACGDVAREDAATQAKALLLPAPPTKENEPTFHCFECMDEPNGWRLFYCLGKGDLHQFAPPAHAPGPVFPCGRLKRHPPHTYAERCKCLATNPVIARAKEFANVSRLKRETRAS